jgi:hypothetical protein
LEYEDDDGTDNHDDVDDDSDDDIEDPSRMICCRYKSIHALDLPRLAMDFKNMLSSNAVGGPERNNGKRLLLFPVSVSIVVVFPIIIFHTDFNFAAFDFVCDKAFIASPKILGVRIG